MYVSMYATVYMRRSGYKHSGLTSFPLPHGSHPGIKLRLPDFAVNTFTTELSCCLMEAWICSQA